MPTRDNEWLDQLPSKIVTWVVVIEEFIIIIRVFLIYMEGKKCSCKKDLQGNRLLFNNTHLNTTYY